jgi:hypothetical protein
VTAAAISTNTKTVPRTAVLKVSKDISPIFLILVVDRDDPRQRPPDRYIARRYTTYVHGWLQGIEPRTDAVPNDVWHCIKNAKKMVRGGSARVVFLVGRGETALSQQRRLPGMKGSVEIILC